MLIEQVANNVLVLKCCLFIFYSDWPIYDETKSNLIINYKFRNDFFVFYDGKRG